MNSSAFFNFLTLLLVKHKSKHLAIFVISTLLVFLLSSTLFITSSLQATAKETLTKQADFIIQKMRAGNPIQTPIKWINAIEDIKGISQINGRVYGRYFLPDSQQYFMIVGVDVFDEQVSKNLQTLLQRIDIKRFIEQNQMIVGKGVASYMHAHHFDAYYHFFTPEGKEMKITRYQTLPTTCNLLANDLVVMKQAPAKQILGIPEDAVSDIIINVANEAERDNIAFKLRTLHFDARIIDKRDVASAYEHYYHYKSGFFLLLFILSLVTFMLILYQRYTMVSSSDKKEIAILRMMGWSIKDVLKLKLYETLFIALFAFFLGVILAYIFVFVFGAPLLRDIFLGFGNLTTDVIFQPVIEGGVLGSLFLFFILPFTLSVLIPVWRIAIIDPYEGMK